MSYADDNGISDYSMIDEVTQLEDCWNKGYHKDNDGNELYLKDMTTSHLLNTIRFFSHLDTSSLEKEVKKRQYVSSTK